MWVAVKITCPLNLKTSSARFVALDGYTTPPSPSPRPLPRRSGLARDLRHLGLRPSSFTNLILCQMPAL